MVDVSEKAVTHREAIATGWISMCREALTAVQGGKVAKGDVLAVAQVAGVMAAKKTAELIPLCHPLPLTGIGMRFVCRDDLGRVDIEATVKTTAQTGVEMEALTAVSVAALTIYDMCKAIDRGMRIGEIRLLHKMGGRSGEWTAERS